MKKFITCFNPYILIYLTLFMALPAAAEHFPEPNPPEVTMEQTEPPIRYRYRLDKAPDTEWTFHKTADGLHPDANEQQMMWLMNRARQNPAAEGIWLSSTGDPDVEFAIDFYHVDLDLLQQEFAAIPAKPPAAFDVRLYEAARLHSEDMITRDAQDHDGQLDLVTASGFEVLAWRGNVYSYAKSALHAHAGFNIDWGPDGGDGSGVQPARGHRKAIMSVDANLTNVGIAVVPENNPDTEVGPLVVTGNYAQADTSVANHYNRFIVGTVWEDLNCNDQYDPGEGLGGVTVTPDKGQYYAVTAVGGGYAIPVDADVTYQVTFSGGGLTAPDTRTVAVGADSVLIDEMAVASPPVAAFSVS